MIAVNVKIFSVSAASVRPALALPGMAIVCSDHVGFGLPDGCGGSTDTPTLTRVANQDVSDHGFHPTAICSPSRAALLTGRNRQRVVPHDR